VAIPITAEPVTRADIQQTTALTGSVTATNQISVLPQASGRLKDLFVDVGSSVKAGDVVAQLDSASAEIAVQQQQATLASAQAGLNKVLAGPKDDDITTAQSQVAAAQARLNGLLAQGRPEDVRGAQDQVVAAQARLQSLQNQGRPESVGQAQANLTSAQAKLDALLQGPTNDQVVADRSAVESDKAAVQSAEAAAAALGTSTASDIQTAQSGLESAQAAAASAQAALDSANAALANQPPSTAANVRAAQSTYANAVASLNAARAALNQNDNPTPAAIAQAQAALATAESQLQSSESQQTSLEQGVASPCASTPSLAGPPSPVNSTACGTAKAAATASVNAGDAAVVSAQAQLDLLTGGGAPATRAQLVASLQQADNNLAAAKSKLDQITSTGIAVDREQALAQQATAESNLVTAQQNVKTAQARLTALQDGSIESQRQTAQSNLIAARQRLQSDQARLEVLLQTPKDTDIVQAQAGVEQAQQALALAQAPNTDQDIRAQQATVDQAQQALSKTQNPNTATDIEQQRQAVIQAQANLHAKENPYTDDDIKQAQGTYAQAQAGLANALLALSQTKVTAPVDGVVSEKLVAPGAFVSQSSSIITLVPPGVDVVANLPEQQLGSIHVGQAVNFTVSAYPGKTFQGTVSTISPTVNPQTRTVQVQIQPTNDQGQLRGGMLANLGIVTASEQDVLTVPRTALINSGAASPGQPSSVWLIDPNNVVRSTAVTLGLVNDTKAEVTSGLAEGQLVATGSISTLTDGQVVAPQVQTLTARVAP
jgi:HlyD family secretion protein